MTEIDIVDHNRKAWDKAVDDEDKWTLPVSEEEIIQAKAGQVHIVLTPQKEVPDQWLGDLKNKDVLCLASGGGQQGPLLASAGARVVVFDNSPKQLAQDEKLAELYQLELGTLQGDMRDLSCFDDESFDLIVHPVSNCFVDDILPVWKESFRVLRKGGVLLSGFGNPLLFAYDRQLEEQGILQLKYPIPFSAVAHLSPEELKSDYLEPNQPVEFGHSLSQQIGGQLEAGFFLAGFYEDQWGDRVHDQYFPHFMATRAIKPL